DLYGEDGNDGLFGGYQDGQDYLNGGPGADRYLQPQSFGAGWMDEDAIGVNLFNGDGLGDAKLNFTAGDKDWTDTEIQQVDVGLSWLQQRTNNTSLLQWGFGQDLMFQRYANLSGAGPGLITLADNNSRGLIRVADGAFGGQTAQTIIHEIGHNW